MASNKQAGSMWKPMACAQGVAKKGFSTSYNPKVSKFDLYCVNVIVKLKVTTEIKMAKGLSVTSTARCRRRGQAPSAVASDGV